MRVYYNKKGDCLECYKEDCFVSDWDTHWKKNFEELGKKTWYQRFVVSVTRKYVPGGKILEGGCGPAGKVRALKEDGYDVYGIDNAKKTIEKVKEMCPELKVQEGDIRHLPFSDEYFDGYWSLGVIEHFYDGCEEVIGEMARVMKKGGYAFVTFPHLSLLRRIKIVLGLYNEIKNEEIKGVFYQYCYDKNYVISMFKNRGFKVVKCSGLDAMKCIKDEVKVTNQLFQKIYDSKLILLRAVKYIFNKIFSGVAGHSILIIMKKIGEDKNAK